MKYFIFVTLFFTGCSTAPCNKFDRVKTIGQCATSGSSSWISATCTALTERGHVVTRSTPMVVGESVCVGWE